MIAIILSVVALQPLPVPWASWRADYHDHSTRRAESFEVTLEKSEKDTFIFKMRDSKKEAIGLISTADCPAARRIVDRLDKLPRVFVIQNPLNPPRGVQYVSDAPVYSISVRAMLPGGSPVKLAIGDSQSSNLEKWISSANEILRSCSNSDGFRK